MIFKQSVPQQLPQEEGLSRIKNSLTKLKHEQKDKVSGIKEDWQNENCILQFTVLGYRFGHINCVPFKHRNKF